MTFRIGETYYDSIGRRWTVIHAAKIRDDWVLLVKEDKWITKKYCLAVMDSQDRATVFLDHGFTTIYADKESE